MVSGMVTVGIVQIMPVLPLVDEVRGDPPTDAVRVLREW